MVRKRLYAFVRICFPSCQTTPVMEVKVVQPSNKLHFGRIASDDNELFSEDAFDDKPAAVMLQSGFAEQLVEADVLHLVKPERVLITRSFRLPDISVCQFSVGIHDIG